MSLEPSYAQVELDMGSGNNKAAIKKLEAVLAEHVASKKSEFKEGSLWVVLAASSLPLKSVLNIECILDFNCALSLPRFQGCHDL